MKAFLMILLGGGLGSYLRYLIYITLNTEQIRWIPTLVANLLGCAILGILFGLKEHGLASTNAYLLLGFGFCGGFTTFSTLSLEVFQFLKNGLYLQAAAYSVGSALLGILVLFLAYKLALSLL
jgi:CrcB protein